MARPRSIAGATPSADEIVAHDDDEHDAREIAAKLGCSERHVVEVLRIEESGSPELKRLIRTSVDTQNRPMMDSNQCTCTVTMDTQNRPMMDI